MVNTGLGGCGYVRSVRWMLIGWWDGASNIPIHCGLADQSQRSTDIPVTPVFRAALEASIIVSVLLALVEQIVQQPGSGNTTAVARERTTDSDEKKREGSHTSESEDLALGSQAGTNALIKGMRILVFAGSVLGLFVALAIGAAFLAVWFTPVNDLFGANEEIWEGTFNLIAAILIFVMGLTMLRIDQAKAKWRAKLHKAFITDVANSTTQGPTSRWAKWNPFRGGRNLSGEDKWEMSSGKWALFLLPFITVMREGLEAVVFIGGVSLGPKTTAIPLAAIVGLLCGLIVGYIIYRSSSRTSISIFLVISTNLLLLVGAGLFSKAIGSFQRNKFNKMVGADVAEAGNGPGSYDVRGNIWHLNCCNPEDKYGNGGWAIFAAIFGWSNDGSVGTVLGYIFYWIAVVVALVVMQINEKKNRRRASAQTA